MILVKDLLHGHVTMTQYLLWGNSMRTLLRKTLQMPREDPFPRIRWCIEWPHGTGGWTCRRNKHTCLPVPDVLVRPRDAGTDSLTFSGTKVFLMSKVCDTGHPVE